MSRTRNLSTRKAVPRKKPFSKASADRVPAESSVWMMGMLSGILAFVSFAAYIPILSHSFVVLDDREYVVANPHIRNLGPEMVRWAFTSLDAANWHPLTWISHAVDYKLFALNATGHHLDSLLIHIVNVGLLFLGLTWLTKKVWRSFFVAGLFALHPINVESVAWIAERKNLLSTLFFLLTIGAYAWYTKNPGWRRYLPMVAAFVAALMSKPMAVTLPFVLLLLDYWPLQRLEPEGANSILAEPATFSKLVLEKAPLLVLSATSSWITLKAQHAVVQTFEEFSLSNRIENAVAAYGLYLWKMMWPSHLTFYSHATGELPARAWALSAAVLIAITIVVVVFRRQRYLPVGWFWFLGTLVPVLGLVQVGEYAMADRYAYIPLIGVFVMLTWGVAEWARARQVRRLWCWVPAICVLVACASATVRQAEYWDSDYHLYSHMLEVEESSFAHNALAMALLNPAAALTAEQLAGFPSESARVDEARHQFERALEMSESKSGRESSRWDSAGTLNNLANLDRLENRLDEAREHNESALRLYRELAQQNPDLYRPYLAVTLNNLGAVNRLQNHMDRAQEDLEESLEINRELARQNPAKYLPNVALILNEYGLVEASQNHHDAARHDYEEALAISRQLAAQTPEVYTPQLTATLTNFALFNVYERHLDEARQRFDEAVKIDRELAEQNASVYLPNLAMGLSNLARVEHMQGRDQSAEDHYKEAYNLLQVLVQSNQSYAGDIARVEASLEDLRKAAPSQPFDTSKAASRAGPH